MKPDKSIWAVLLAVIALGALLAIIYIVDERDTTASGIPDGSVDLHVAAGCQIEQGCVVSAQNTSVVVTLGPSLQYLKPFPVTVDTRGMGDGQVVSVTMEFYMRGMEMPLRPIALTYKKSEQHWRAEVILPLCSSGRRDWVGHLRIKTETVSYTSDIVFEVSG